MRAVITGATGGIGGATAEALGRAGYEVIITGIDLEAGKKVIDKLESQGIKVHFYACDATNEEQVNETFAKIGEEFGSLDLLVNNVGGLGGRQRVRREQGEHDRVRRKRTCKGAVPWAGENAGRAPLPADSS